jgi:hypothetical protein
VPDAGAAAAPPAALADGRDAKGLARRQNHEINVKAALFFQYFIAAHRLTEERWQIAAGYRKKLIIS